MKPVYYGESGGLLPFARPGNVHSSFHARPAQDKKEVIFYLTIVRGPIKTNTGTYYDVVLLTYPKPDFTPSSFRLLEDKLKYISEPPPTNWRDDPSLNFPSKLRNVLRYSPPLLNLALPEWRKQARPFVFL